MHKLIVDWRDVELKEFRGNGNVRTMDI